ncbi:2OG-Fe(II) oxygenase [Phenylobacterium sp.]|uniref:2OG-Fe(II) oxygenase n=1 Tax=Phenylobacterium sp. TaxID=1871053 RepID=UPI0027307565|nr:2OG-Fe(II) oxygenase [Phenylobacterium sp.]MDP1618426.1 2OG-Fe(II) oxygenase [Phenylobacterium sp.]MDP1987556.1 2OG-Fe(II) oxygenase [Phenylobacterium sp.]
MLRPGQPTPWFTTPSPVNPEFAFGSLGGRFMLMVFLPEPGEAREVVLGHLRANSGLFDDDKVYAFAVARDEPTIATATNTRALRWFFDPDGKVSRLYHALSDQGPNPHFVLIDPSMRIYAVSPIDGAEAMMRVVAQLPSPDDHARTPLHAPVLIVPRIFEPDICRQLMTFYEEHGGRPSGVMREINGQVQPVMDHTKRRRDAMVEDEGLRALLRQRLQTRLLPEIAKAFQFQVTRVERYLVACYDSNGGGFFQPHRDNTTRATAHRQFACSINLNAEGHEGGDLRFPEFGSRTYRPPSGGAVVFSCSLMHEATPVTSGKRYCFLPFFYNEPAAQLRERYLAEEAAAKVAASAEPAVQPA